VARSSALALSAQAGACHGDQEHDREDGGGSPRPGRSLDINASVWLS